MQQRSSQRSSRRPWALLVGGSPEAWATQRTELDRKGIDVEPLGRDVDPEAVAKRARSEGAIVIVDLTRDGELGMATLLACRREGEGIPVVVIAENPSVELVRRIRAAGVFFVALHPVTTDEARDILSDAFRHVGGKNTAPSICGGVKRILIVDDDADYRSAMESLLTDQGYSVTTAANGKEALKRILAERPDLIVLDIMMEYDAAGYEVTHALKFAQEYEDVRRVPVLMVSSIELDPATRFSRSDEAAMIQPDAYMTKPLDLDEFLARVSTLLGAHAERHS